MELILLSAIGTTALLASELCSLVLRGGRRHTLAERRRPVAATVFIQWQFARDLTPSRPR